MPQIARGDFRVLCLDSGGQRDYHIQEVVLLAQCSLCVHTIIICHKAQ